MKRQKRLTLSTAVMAAVFSLGLAGTALAANEESSQDPMPNFPQIIEKMMEDVRFGGHRRGHRELPFSARPLVSISLRNHEELKLSDDQVKLLKDIRDAFSKKAVKQRAEMKSRRIDLKRALDNEKVDLTDVEKKIREISNMRADLRIARLKAIQEGKSVLNAEQQKQLSKIARKRPGRGPRFHRQMFKDHGFGNRSQTY